MIQGDIYLHYKGKEYMFEGIALSIETNINLSEYTLVGEVKDANTPDDEDIIILNLYEKNNEYFIEGYNNKVIYYCESDYVDGVYWGRNVDDFYSDVTLDDERVVKRFKKIY